MKSLRTREWLYTTLFVLYMAGRLAAQGDPATEQGLKAYGAYSGGNIDVVSIESGKIDLHVPVLSYPQRGNLEMTFTLRYFNPIFTLEKDCEPTTPPPPCTYTSSGEFGGVYVSSDFAAFSGKSVPYMMGTQIIGTVYSIVAPDNGTHPLGALSGGTAFESVDAQGWHWDKTTNVMTDPNGIRYTPGAQVEDTNGNQLSHQANGTWKDSIGRIVPIPPPLYSHGDGAGTIARCPAGPLPVHLATDWTVPAPADAGGSAKYTFCYALVPIAFNFHPGPYGVPFNASLDLLQSLVLPNGQYWMFAYNDTYGDLTQITLPTGGTISYTWNNNAQMCFASDQYPQTYFSAVFKRTVNANDGSGDRQWTYSGFVPFSDPTPGLSRTVTDPLGNQEVHTLSSMGSACSFYETTLQNYQGASSGTPVETVTTQYTYSIDPNTKGGKAAINVVPVSVTTSWANVTTQQVTKTKQVTKAYDSGFTYFPVVGPSQTATYGRVLTESEYDYGAMGSTSPGSLARRTVYNYQAFYNGMFLFYNILSPLRSVAVYDSTANQCHGVATYCAYTLFGYDESTPSGSGVTTQHNAAPLNGQYRANQTSVQRWLDATGGYITTTKTFFDTGMVYQDNDAASNHNATFAYSGTFFGAYPTQTCNALTQCTANDYDFNTGLLKSVTDPNSKTTTTTYDNMWRATRVAVTNPPASGQTDFCYTDTGGVGCTQASAPYQVVVTKKLTSSLNMVTTGKVDGLGRATQTQMNSDPDGIVYVDTTYDQNGRKATVSNPYRTSGGVTTMNYDALNRTIKVSPPDGGTSNNVTTDFSNFPYVTTTDQAGKQRKTLTDGMDRLIAAWEDPAGSNYETDYQYDALGNLKQVTQQGNSPGDSSKWRVRSFSYDSLSRLSLATNPESGAINYFYTTSGGALCSGDPSAVCRKTAPAPNQSGSATVTTTYTYDSVHRLTGKTYSDGTTPAVKYGYDGVALSGCTTTPPALSDSYPTGLRTAMCDGSGATSWNHDQLGRTSSEKRTIVGSSNVTNTISYTYNLLGGVATLTYPSGRAITYTPNSSGTNTAGRMKAVQDTANGINYVTNAVYTPDGAPASFKNGSSIVAAFSYNSRMQPKQIYYGTTAAPDLSALTCPSTVGNIMHRVYIFGEGANDNGNVQSITNCRDTNRTQNFTYDALNRILYAWSSGPNWGETFTIDSWGNLTNVGSYGSKTFHENLNAAPATVKNQLPGYGHDAAGNMTLNGSATYTFDAENRLISTGGYTYGYDGDGERIKKTNGSTGTLYWSGVGSDAIVETSLTGTLSNEYIFFNGKRVARRDGSGGAVHYYFADHLGSIDLITSNVGVVQKESDYTPYGGEMILTGSDGNNYKFTGKERDESGLDNFGARYYASTMGRFMTPDWAAKATAVPYAEFGDPQSLNLYSYVRNNPLSRADLDGHCQKNTPKCKDLATNPLLNTSDAIKQAIHNAVKASNKPTADDKKGGSHEEGFVAYTQKGTQTVAPAVPGKSKDVKEKGVVEMDPFKAADPSKQIPGDVQADVVAHVHPSATADLSAPAPLSGSLTTTIGGTTSTNTAVFGQAPSPQDIEGALPAPTLNLVIGARDSTVYVYNSSGCTCTESLQDLDKEPKH